MSISSTPVSQPDKSIDIKEFTNDARIMACIAKLKGQFGENYERLIVSDTLDKAGNQYVDLVQKGGGVLGIALVGYTYILEMAGIRFMRMAGTSAGAINTALMTVIGNKNEMKSHKILDTICKLDFFNLVDGHPFIRKVIKIFITHADFSVKFKKWLILFGILFGTLILGDVVFLGLEAKFPMLSILTRGFFVFTGLFLLGVVLVVSYLNSLLKRFKESGFGINPGDFFYDWIKVQLKENGVDTVTDLKNKAAAPIEGLYLRNNRTDNIDDIKGVVTFITSEVVTENKIQFPEMSSLFKQNIDDLQPAGFIRASMSIPIFFESYFIKNIDCTSKPIMDAWKERFNVTEPPSTARFVDGGILSDFPMSIFYRPNISIPRMPTFGIDLDDNNPDDQELHASNWTLAGYFGRIFNTTRFYYDKDFLLKNKMFGKGIGKVLLYKFNWLNFFLKPEEKKDMFWTGAEAATEFLLHFSWQEYKDNREEGQKELVKLSAIVK